MLMNILTIVVVDVYVVIRYLYMKSGNARFLSKYNLKKSLSTKKNLKMIIKRP